MSWNYRLLAHKDGEDVFLQIHEVYYDEEGKPHSYTENGVTVSGESLECVKWVLSKMKKCTNKPILSVENFPEEYKTKIKRRTKNKVEVDILDVGLRLGNIKIEKEVLSKIIDVFLLIQEKGGEADLKDMSELITSWELNK